MPRESLDPLDEDLVRAYYRSFNERRFEEPLDFLADHATLHHVPTEESLVGAEGYRAFSRAWLAAFPDATIDVVAISRFGQRGIQVDLIGRGTHRGRFELGGQHFEPTGRAFATPFRHILAIEDGKIVESWLDFDAAGFAKSLKGE